MLKIGLYAYYIICLQILKMLRVISKNIIVTSLQIKEGTPFFIN